MPYPHSASSPPSTKKSRAMPVCGSGSVAGLSNRACSVGFASCETLGKHYHASLRLRSFGSARPCADFVRPLSCILCTFMNALWALRPCKAFGRSFYKASVPYPQVAGSPSRRTKNNTPLVERGIIFGADGGGRTRTVLLPTDFESVTSANSITSAYYIIMCCKTALHNGNNDFTV